MVEEFRTAFQELIDASVATDPHQFPPAVHLVHTLAAQVPATERDLALQALTTLLSQGHLAPGIAADLCVLAGALVEVGTDPGPAPPQILRLLRSAGQGAIIFTRAWQRTGTTEPPAPEQVTAAAETRVAADLGPQAAPAATMCWWTITRHGLAARTMLSQAPTRALLRRDPALHAELMAVANQLSNHLPEFEDIRALLRMSEATCALVMDRDSGRAFRVLFDGIGDNRQLHTLLAAALIGEQGQHLAGRAPDPSSVEALRDGPAQDQAVQGWWNLLAHDGTWVWNEGVPAEIPTLEGERVLVLDEQTYPRSWKAARRHPHIAGWLVVESELPQAEADRWWKRLTPARNTLTGTRPGPPRDAAEADQGPDGPTIGEEETGPAPRQEHPPAPAPDAQEPHGHTAEEGHPGPGPRRAPRSHTPPEPQTEPEPHESDPSPGPRRAHPGLGLPPLPPEVSRSQAWGPAWRH